jgi:hypothetical protein
VGFVMSVALALLMLVEGVRESGVAWLFLPILILPVVLVVRANRKQG